MLRIIKAGRETKVRLPCMSVLSFSFPETVILSYRELWYSGAQLGNHEGIWIVAVK